MNEAAVIMPVTAASDFLLYVASVGIRTLAASTKQTILVLGNNTPDPNKRESIRMQCAALGCRYEYIEGPFSLTKFWNHGIDATSEPYLAFANQDCIYYQGWLENMIQLSKYEPSFFMLWPWSFSEVDAGVAFTTSIHPQNDVNYGAQAVLQHHHPCTLVFMKRSDGYRWDERFKGWELDADIVKYVESKKLKIGMCLNARVDHFSETVKNSIDIAKHYADDDYFGNAKRALKEKWNC